MGWKKDLGNWLSRKKWVVRPYLLLLAYRSVVVGPFAHPRCPCDDCTSARGHEVIKQCTLLFSLGWLGVALLKLPRLRRLIMGAPMHCAPLQRGARNVRRNRFWGSRKGNQVPMTCELGDRIILNIYPTPAEVANV